MANLGQYQDTANGQMAEDRTVLPAGEYEAAIVKSEEKSNKANTGSYINLEFEVQSGQHQGRRFWEMLNLNNPNAQAVEIANRSLNSICNACGKLRASVQNTEELHGIPMRVTLGVRQQDGYDPQNNVKSYKPLNGGGQVQHGAQQQGAGQGKPWNNQNAA